MRFELNIMMPNTMLATAFPCILFARENITNFQMDSGDSLISLNIILENFLPYVFAQPCADMKLHPIPLLECLKKEQ